MVDHDQARGPDLEEKLDATVILINANTAIGVKYIIKYQ